MTAGTSILAVDDDPRIRDMLCRYLEGEGYRVTAVSDGAAMHRHLSEAKVDLVLLDLGLPGEDGFSLARQIREVSSVPIIMVTGKGDMIDRVAGLELGADDYITKPFHLREILARIRTVLRRSSANTNANANIGERRGEDASDEVAGGYAFAGWRFDPVKRELISPEGESVKLTTGEFDLLAVFVRAPNRPLSRDQLMDLSRGREWSPLDRAIDTQVGRLRKKLERDPGNPELIKTVRNLGYVFATKVTKT